MTDSVGGDSTPFGAGPREFSCAQCGRCLRVQMPIKGPVKCPSCEHVQFVPGSQEVATGSNAVERKVEPTTALA